MCVTSIKSETITECFGRSSGRCVWFFLFDSVYSQKVEACRKPSKRHRGCHFFLSFSKNGFLFNYTALMFSFNTCFFNLVLFFLNILFLSKIRNSDIITRIEWEKWFFGFFLCSILKGCLPIWLHPTCDQSQFFLNVDPTRKYFFIVRTTYSAIFFQPTQEPPIRCLTAICEKFFFFVNGIKILCLRKQKPCFWVIYTKKPI